MIVAQLRGVEFYQDNALTWHAAGAENERKGSDALDDVAEWLHYESYREYLYDLPTLKRKIFDRIKRKARKK